MSNRPLYIYGLLCAAPDGLAQTLTEMKTPDGAGPAELIEAGPFIAVASPHDGSEVLQRRRNMLAHTRLLEASMPYTTVLPMRFGIVADQVPMFAEMLSQKEPEIRSQFETLDGSVELGLRIAWPRDAALSALAASEPSLRERHIVLAARGPEAHYQRIEFGRKVAEALDSRRKTAESALLEVLRPISRSHILRAAEEDVEVLRAEFLVAADRQSEFIEVTEAAVEACDFAAGAPAAVRCVGPAPAYNFVSLSLGSLQENDTAQKVA